jgi:hypothetical protein
MVLDLASLSAAHAWNIAVMNSPHMESWYQSHFNPQQHLSDMYKYILAQQLQLKEVKAFKESESHQHQTIETQDMHHFKSACSQRMCKLLDKYIPVKIKVMKWMGILDLLWMNRVQIIGLPAIEESPLLGSWLAEKYCTVHWSKMCDAFTCTADHGIHLEELPEFVSESEDAALPIMVDHSG